MLLEQFRAIDWERIISEKPNENKIFALIEVLLIHRQPPYFDWSETKYKSLIVEFNILKCTTHLYLIQKHKYKKRA